MATHKAKLAIVTTILLSVLSSPIVLSQKVDNFSISINPVDQNQEKKTKLIYQLRPTEQREDLVTIRNNSNQKLKVNIYAVDSKQGSDGAVAFKLANEERNFIGKWLAFDSMTQEIEAGKSLYLPYNISIPALVTPGSYQGAIAVEVINESPSKSAIQIVTRIVEPVYIGIPGRKEAKYELNDFSYQISNSRPSFYIKFSNSGNIILKGALNIRVEGTLLNEPYEINLNHPTILPGETYEKLLQFENSPLMGEYQAVLNFQVNEMDLNEDKLIELQTIKKIINFTIIDWNCILALIILIIMIIIAEYLRRKYFNQQNTGNFIHIVKKGENLSQIAKTYHIKWQTIVRLNKLHKPYSLKIGQELTLPFPKIKNKTKS